MAVAKEMMGCSSFVSSSKVFRNSTYGFQQKQNPFLFVKPVWVSMEQKRRVHLRKAAKVPVVAAISEDLIKAKAKAVPAQKEKAVEFKVTATVTIRNKNKEDFKETLVKHFDAFTDMIGRNVVLELISTEEDPSKKILLQFCFLFSFNL